MNWKELWMTLFGTCEWLGLNMGFWVSMAAVLLIVITHECHILGNENKPLQIAAAVCLKKSVSLC